jgi:hypothetical protein
VVLVYILFEKLTKLTKYATINKIHHETHFVEGTVVHYIDCHRLHHSLQLDERFRIFVFSAVVCMRSHGNILAVNV